MGGLLVLGKQEAGSAAFMGGTPLEYGRPKTVTREARAPPRLAMHVGDWHCPSPLSFSACVECPSSSTLRNDGVAQAALPGVVTPLLLQRGKGT